MIKARLTLASGLSFPVQIRARTIPHLVRAMRGQTWRMRAVRWVKDAWRHLYFGARRLLKRGQK